MVKYILDTSTILDGIYGSKEGLKNFIRLSEQIKQKKAMWYSTPLLYFEFNNAIRFRFDPLSCTYLFEHFLKLKIKRIHHTKKELSLARNLAFETNSTFYDASFHMLAITRSMVFLTMDRKYYKKARSKGNIELFSTADF